MELVIIPFRNCHHSVCSRKCRRSGYTK